MTASTHKHQMSRHDRTWGTSIGGGKGRVEALAADEAQDWSALRGRAGFHDLHVNSPGLRARHFSQFQLRALDHSAAAHRRLAGPLPVERAATLIVGHAVRNRRRGRFPRGAVPIECVCAFVAAHRQFSLSDHLPCRDTDLLEAHFLERLSSRAGFDDQQLSERLTHRVGPFTQGLGNV